ncbi:MAG TPA: FAD-binding oxidoreductase [Acidimicrobiales bacterium]|nr:FAD-binding oxidoreductase [Acidimicrobiales bacterium]
MNYDVIVVGAGITGAACAYWLARAGLRVAVVERGTVASGTTGAGEGNILVSDKPPGPELDLAVLSSRLWRELAPELGVIELEEKGGLVVATDPRQWNALEAFAASQRPAGVEAEAVPAERLGELEPLLAPGLAGGYLYRQDMQVQPMLAAAGLLARARALGAVVRLREEVTGLTGSGEAVTGVLTGRGRLAAGVVVNAAGAWASEVAAWAGVEVPVRPRRGFVLVTEPLPLVIRHKVYTADYVANVAADTPGLETSTVVESTAAGTVLIGASRERVGWDPTPSLAAIGTLAAKAVWLVPALGSVRALRYYRGFRPYCPDHLPVIGADPRRPGLVHACGHEGAGIGLAAATGRLVAQAVTGEAPDLPLEPFRPDRFGQPARA